MSLTLVIGGVRSGKSARAEALASATGLPVRYIATADPADSSMADRIAAHAARRPRDWTTAVADRRLPLGAAGCLLLDGLGVWIAGVDEGAVADGIAALIAASASRPVIVVAEEAGLGLLGTSRVARAWLDTLGQAVQRLSAAADRVELVVAGRPLVLASSPSPADGLRRHGDELVRPGDADYAVNVLAGGPPPWLRSALQSALECEADSYPSEQAAVRAVAALHGRGPEEIVPTNGAAQALWLLPSALRPALAACVHPGFTEGEVALRAHGIPVARVLRDPDHGFVLDPRAVPEAADLVLVGNPASPSGQLDPAGAVMSLRRPGRTIVVDEAFMDLVPGQPESLVSDALPDVIVVRSLTKSLSVPGLRVGYAVAAPQLADRLRAVRPAWSVNVLALAALTAAAGRPEALAAAAVRAGTEREDLQRGLASIPRVRTWPSSTNFCLIEVPDGPRVTAALRAGGIAVRPADSFPGLAPSHLRLTARGRAANARLVAALGAAVAGCP
ncbi:MAG TPA: bifunctional adenosylcobinamide kinase/adenosylcobinamide-phosphate guanylyltransferase [Solirubrobacteraceae bacterium]|nr:bifunctional adenosylcobinamide kinase/adenosylcobinamide-phosphate guanylyltransferase [Solirubrobacteraceae bacterium]